MKILLLHPGMHYLRDGLIKRNKIITEHTLPLGILYVGEMLKQENYDVHYFDHAVIDISVDDLVKWIIAKKFNIVGYSVLGGTFLTSIEIARRLKKIDEDIINVFGGIQATLCAGQILQEYNCVDYCVRGEGELTFLELVKTLESHHEIKEIKGITYRENDLVKSTADRPLIKNLDELPIPDRSPLLKAHKYILGAKNSPLITSRGCVYNCSFCACRVLFNRTLRFRSPESVIDELIYLENEGFKEVTLSDDCFTANPKRVTKICELMKKNKIDIQWHANSRTDLGNLNIYRQMVKAGCVTISFGIESGVQRILDYYNKRTTVDTAITSVKIAKKARITNIFGAFIVGAPGETKKEIIQTLKFGLKLNLTSLQFQLLHILPGTSIFNEFIEKGWIEEATAWEAPIIAADVCPEVVKKDLLEKYIEIAYQNYVAHPKRILNEYIQTVMSRYRTQVIANIPTQIKEMLSSKK